LYGFLILQHSRRELVWLGVTARPSARWIARQLTENNPETLSHIQSLADYTIDTLESSFQKRQVSGNDEFAKGQPNACCT
jgi:hypothetical protein